jgi:protein-arginine kinase activator protein McsA
MLSSNAFQIVHDGAAFPRLDKMREITKWPEAMQNLRVCWQGNQKDRNCGRCEKCVRTILNFRILGVGLPECFEQDVTDDQIRNIRVTSGPLTEMERVLEAAKSAGISASWVQALESCIRRNQLQETLEKSKTTLETTLKKSMTALKQSVPVPLKKQVRQLRSLLPKRTP